MHYFAASDGARIAYRDQGAGRPILFLHGLMAHSGFFHGQDRLADAFRLIAVDLRAHGGSRAPGQHPAVAQLADDVAALCQHLGLEGVIGVGWSLGGSILWDLLSGPARNRFAGGVIVDMTPRVENGPDWPLGLAADHVAQRSAAMAADFPAFAAAAGRAIFADAERNRGDAEWAAEEFQKNDPEAIGALWQSLAREDYRDRLPRIDTAMLVAHGARSHLYGPATAEYIAAAMPNARRIQFDQSGHSPHIEQPDLFNQILTDFAASLPSVPKPHETAV